MFSVLAGAERLVIFSLHLSSHVNLQYTKIFKCMKPKSGDEPHKRVFQCALRIYFGAVTYDDKNTAQVSRTTPKVTF